MVKGKNLWELKLLDFDKELDVSLWKIDQTSSDCLSHISPRVVEIPEDRIDQLQADPLYAIEVPRYL